MSAKTLSAWEIAEFLFCQRAWWYSRQGEPSAYEDRRQAGVDWHRRQTGQALQAGCLRLAGYLFLTAAVVLSAVWLTLQVIG